MKKILLFVVFLTFAISSLSTTIVFPILAPLFLGNVDTIIRPEIPENIKAILFGIFLAVFPFAQFLFAPVIGELSDRQGRKKAFCITLFLEFLGYVLSAVGIRYHHLSVLFLGRFITGLGAGNLSVCLATLVDLSENEKKRARYFSYGSAVAGIMFVLGPFLGGKFSDSSISSLFNLAFPLWIGAALTLLNLGMICLFFKETLGKKQLILFDPAKAIHNIQSAFHTGALRSLYVIFFFFLFAWNMLYQFLPALIVEEFNGSSVLIGNLSAFMGIVWFVGTVVISLLEQVIPHKKILLFSILLLFAGVIVFIPHPKSLSYFTILCGIAVFFAGGIWPILMSSISKTAALDAQGKILGVSQSIQSLSMLLAPFVGGFFLQAHSEIPFIVASCAAIVAAILLSKSKAVLH